MERTKLGLWAALALGAACSTQAASTTSSGNGGTTHGTGATTHASSSSSTVASGAGGSGSAGAGGMGGAGGGAPCVGQPGTFYAQSAYRYGDPGPTPMCNYEGDVILVVNTADV
jgi:hypothetical protein